MILDLLICSLLLKGGVYFYISNKRGKNLKRRIKLKRRKRLSLIRSKRIKRRGYQLIKKRQNV